MRKINKINHINNGNIKFLHLNKGSSNILTKIDLITDLVNHELPSIISFNKSNVDLNQPDQLKPIPDYNFEHKSLQVNQVHGSKARTTMAIHHKLDYERMYTLENNINSIIWIKVKIKRQRPILVMSGYRQHKLLDEFQVKNSHTIRAQKLRLTSYLETYQECLSNSR